MYQQMFPLGTLMVERPPAKNDLRLVASVHFRQTRAALIIADDFVTMRAIISRRLFLQISENLQNGRLVYFSV
jgi:hypothetical protein